jgi:hypothetical protein
MLFVSFGILHSFCEHVSATWLDVMPVAKTFIFISSSKLIPSHSLFTVALCPNTHVL